MAAEPDAKVAQSVEPSRDASIFSSLLRVGFPTRAYTLPVGYEPSASRSKVVET